MKRKQSKDANNQPARKRPKTIQSSQPASEMTASELVTELSWSADMTATRWKALYKIISGKPAERGQGKPELREYCRSTKLTRSVSTGERTALVKLLEEMRVKSKDR